MNNHLSKTIYAVLLVMIYSNSCNGQTKTQSATATQSEITKIPVAHPKMVKTQGSGDNDNIHCGLQDKFGSLWFGTTGDGVYRFDGKVFKQFTEIDGLSSNTIWSLLEDNLGNIWIGTNFGLCKYDGKNITKISLPNDYINYPTTKAENVNSIKNDIWSLMQDKHKTIWICSNKGVYCYNGVSFNRFLDNDSIINKRAVQLNGVQSILEDRNGNIWFGSGMPPGSEGVIRYDGKELTSSKPNGDGWIRYIIEDKQGKIWFGGRNKGNFIYDGSTFKNFTEKIDIGNSILCDKKGTIWFTGAEANNSYENKNGIWTYDGKDFKNLNKNDGLGNYFVHFMMEDKDGNIWIGTRKTGLYRYDGKTFTNFTE